MITNKKIKDKINEELKPDCSFDEFCQNHGVEYVPEEYQHKKSIDRKKIFIYIAVTAALALCIGLPLAITNNTTVPSATIYGDEEVSFQEIQYDELLADNKLFMFDLSKSESYSNMRRVFPIGESNITLGYSIISIVYGFEREDVFYAYEFDYIVRSYTSYEFSDIENYSGLESEIVYDGTKFEYVIGEYNRKAVAYISFKKDDYDYYVSLRGFEDMTEINNSSVETFIKNVLME